MLLRLCRPFRRTRVPPLRLHRSQHIGPHKEYFQNPRQYPQGVSIPPATQARNALPYHAIRSDRSILQSVLRSTCWASLFGVAGLAAGTALITWDYINTPLDPDTEEELELFEDIVHETNEHPLVQSLQKDSEWAERKVYEHVSKEEYERGLKLFTKTYLGSRGLFVVRFLLQLSAGNRLTVLTQQREFFHEPSGILMLVVYVGDGVEGWPDTAHGGIIMTLLGEAMERNANNYPNEIEGRYVELASIDVNFLQRVQPGNIYAVLVQPGLFYDEMSTTERVRPGEGGEELADVKKELLKVTTNKMEAIFIETETIPLGHDQEIHIYAKARGTLNAPIHSHTPVDQEDAKPIWSKP